MTATAKQTIQPPRRTVHAPRLSTKAVGNPNTITLDEKILNSIPGYDQKEERLLLGWLGGTATQVHINRRANITGDGVTEWRGLKGDFQAIPLDHDYSIVKSGLLYLPESMMPAFENHFQPDDDTGKSKIAAAAVRLAFAVYAHKATNPRGYEWLFESIMEVEAVPDALSHMQTIMATAGALPAPASVPALPAPEEAPASIGDAAAELPDNSKSKARAKARAE